MGNGKEFLDVYLHYNNIIDKEDRWSVVATYELRLLSSNSGLAVGGDVVKIIKDWEFKCPHFSGLGWEQFISVDELRSGSFIQNDTIKLQIQLSTKNFKRIRTVSKFELKDPPT